MAGAPKTPELCRFMAKVRVADSGCWMWAAYRMKNGYGLFRTPTRNELAHRVSHRLFNGPLDSRDVMHSCDTPACVNPMHLRLGTRTENMQDAKRKLRIRRGGDHGRAKLTNTQIEFARSAPGLQREIAAVLGISQGHVSHIRRTKHEMGIAQEGNYYC